MSKWIIGGVLLAAALPVWRSGDLKMLSFYQFMYNHTIFAPRPMYVPVEYTIDGVKSTTTGKEKPIKLEMC